MAINGENQSALTRVFLHFWQALVILGGFVGALFLIYEQKMSSMAAENGHFA